MPDGRRAAKRFPPFVKNLFWSLAAVAFLWAAWLAVHALVKNDYLFPSFCDSMREAGRLLMDKDFWHAFSGTFLRMLAAFFLSFIGASVLAVVAYLVPPVGRFLAPLVSVLRSLPTMAVILIILVWTTPKTAPVVVAFLALFPMLYAGISAALASVDPKLVEMSRVYRVPVRKRIFGLYLPSAAPYALREASAALSFSLKLTVSAEVLANTYQSLGGMLQEAKLYVEMPSLFALTILVLATGFLLEGLGSFAARLAGGRR